MIKSLHIQTFTWSPYFETSIELAVLDSKIFNTEVFYIFVFSLNYDQGFNLKKTFSIFIKLLYLIKILKKFKIKYKIISANIISNKKFGNFNNYEDLEKFKYKNTDISNGVMSTLNDLSTNKTYDINNNFNYYANKVLNQSIQIYDIIEKQILKYNPDCITTFNTRFAATRPIYEVSIKHKIKLNTFDSPEAINKYFITENSLFDGHDKSDRILEAWENGGAEKIEIGTKSYKNLKKVFEFSENKFDIQNFISPNKINIIFFPSSIHETFALGNLYKHNLFESQNSALKYLINYSKLNENINLIIRLHPILKEKDIVEQKFWKDFTNHKHIKVIDYDSKISSYDLLKYVNFCITYHSTIGIEAAYLNIKSIILGSPWYVNLKCVYAPKSLDELNEILKTGKINHEFNFKESLYYTYYLTMIGTEYKYIKAKTKNDVRLFGLNLNTYKDLFKNLINE